MPPSIQVGSILIEEWPTMTKLLGLESEPYTGNWGVVQALNGSALDRKIRAARWNFFFMAEEVKVMFWGALGAARIQNSLKRILIKLRLQNFSSLEVTGIVVSHFLGVPYTTVSAHPRHIQQSCYLDGPEARRTSERDAEGTRD